MNHNNEDDLETYLRQDYWDVGQGIAMLGGLWPGIENPNSEKLAKYQKMIMIWRQCNHPRVSQYIGEKEAHPVSYFIEWAISKNLPPDWLDWAIGKKLYIPKPAADNLAHTETQLPVSSTATEPNTMKADGGTQKLQGLQEERILQIVRDVLKLNPLDLPANVPGKKGVKSAVKDSVLENEFLGTRFKKAWERLFANGQLRYGTKPYST